jgi:hypothetical protein
MSNTATQTTTETLAIKTYNEYLYNFKGGGWNTSFGYSKLQAYKKAVQHWTNQGNLDLASKVDKKSFRIASEAEMKNLLSMFW